ncbi:MAG: two-component sensor histidine kinase [Desulfovibrio sp.]|nr:two-component sensor histidine kinase [Desulfovibrio sp.]
MHPEKKSSYDKLSRNLALTVITVSIAPLILVGGLIFDQFRSIYKEKVYSHLAEVVDKHKENINTFLEEKLGEVHYLEQAFSYEELTDDTKLDEILRGMQQQYGRIFVDLGVINAEGRQIAYAGPFNLQGADYSGADWYQNSRSHKAGISDVFLGLRQSPHFIITVNNFHNGEQWTLRATIDFLAFSHLVENIRIGETGAAYILNDEGVFQTRPRENYGKGLVLTPQRVINHPTPDNVSITKANGSDGELYISVTAPLNDGAWKLVYLQRASDAFSAMTRTEYVTLIIFLLGGIGIVLMALLVARKLVVRCQVIDREAEMMNKQMVETGKLAAIGELAAGIAHEINNPVAIMIEEAGWGSDLLEDESGEIKSAGEIERALLQVQTQGRRCKDITHKLLSFARQTDSRVTDVSLPPLIREVVDISMQPARYAQVDFSLNLDDDMPQVRASVTELQQVFLNLINNSIQAMDAEGGTLSVTCSEQDGQAQVVIADTGPGIPAANLSRIFEPFFTTKPVGKGSGLGLSICFGIIHQMGGEIDVDSTVGVGTRFTIRLPLLPHPIQEPTKELHHD